MKKNLQALFPLMLKKQKASLDDNDTFSYISKGITINIKKDEISKINFIKTVFYFLGVIPIRVWDIEIVDTNNKKHTVKNLKIDSKEIFVSRHKNESVQISELPSETGILFFEIVRDHSGRMPRWASVMISVVVFLLLLLSVYTLWLRL